MRNIFLLIYERHLLQQPILPEVNPMNNNCKIVKMKSQ
jgi:hypothetical protein